VPYRVSIKDQAKAGTNELVIDFPSTYLKVCCLCQHGNLLFLTVMMVHVGQGA